MRSGRGAKFDYRCVDILIWNVGIGFNLYAPFWVEESSDHHRGGREDGAEYLAVSAANLFPIFSMGEKHTRADDLIEAGTGFLQGSLDKAEGNAGLLGRGAFFSADGSGAGDMHIVAHANSA